MNLKFLKSILFFLPNLSCGSEGKMRIGETLDKNIVKFIFRDNGIYDPNLNHFSAKNLLIPDLKSLGLGKINHVCKSIDGKTNRLYGKSLCKQAVQRLKGKNMVLEEKLECVDILLEKSEILGIPADETHIGIRLFRMVKCSYEHLLMENDFFYLYNTPKEDYYYIFKHVPLDQTKVTLDGCIKIPFQKKDYPKIEIHETQDPNLADDIFGYYGQNTGRNKILLSYLGNVNGKTSNSKKFEKKIPLYLLCEKVMSLNEYKFRGFENLQKPVEFTQARIRRRVTNPVTMETVKTPPVPMIKCKYDGGYFTILIGPKEDFYYIGEKSITGFENEIELKAVIIILL